MAYDYCSLCDNESDYLIRVNHYWEEEDKHRSRIDEMTLCPDCFKREVLGEE